MHDEIDKQLRIQDRLGIFIWVCIVLTIIINLIDVILYY